MALSYKEKLDLTVGKDNWYFNIPKTLNGRVLKTSDGPLGIREEVNGTTLKAISFPSSAALAASFDKDLVYEINRQIALEAKNRGISVMLTPGINIKRNPLCGRNFEYFSEDPVLSGTMGASAIKGLQSEGYAACLKHYLLNNFENTRFNVSHNVDKKALNEIYLKNFKIAVEGGSPASIMTSYNLVNGSYISESKELLDLPRKWGFKGIYISDWGGVRDKRKALKSGLDIEMPHSNNNDFIEIDDSFKKDIDRASNNVINFIKKYSIPESYKPTQENKGIDLAALANANSLVLLKNEDNILPLKKNESIALIGRLSDEPCYAGYGSSKVECEYISSLKDSLKHFIPNVTYTPGYDEAGKTNDLYLSKIEECIKGKDKVVFVLGSLALHEGEGYDRLHMSIPQGMLRALSKAYELNSNLVVIIEAGSPIELPNIKENSKAILLSYMGGETMSQGIAMALSGLVSPSGRMPETWPLCFKDSPIYHNYDNDPFNLYQTESIYVGYRYYDIAGKDVLFPFGYGLSYSTFDLSNTSIKVSKNSVIAKVLVKNTGSFDASEVVLLYASKKESNTYRPLKELVGFKKVFLHKGEKKVIQIEVPIDYLYVYDFDSQEMVLENGTYTFMLGENSLSLNEKVDIKINFGKDLEDYRDIAPSYFNPKDNKFPKHEFMIIFDGDINHQNEEKEVNWNTLIQTLNYSENGIKAINTLNKIIDELFKDDKDKAAVVKQSVLPMPFRIVKTFSGLGSDELFLKLIKIANGEENENSISE